MKEYIFEVNEKTMFIKADSKKLAQKALFNILLKRGYIQVVYICDKKEDGDKYSSLSNNIEYFDSKDWIKI